MTAGASKAAPTTIQQPALAPSPPPRPAPTGRALPLGLAAQGGQNWTPIRGQIWAPIDNPSKADELSVTGSVGVTPSFASAASIAERFDNDSVCRLSNGKGMSCERTSLPRTGIRMPRARARLASAQTQSDFTESAVQITIAARACASSDV